jgi:mannitol/fructose-specific phosphotransferase system IIA component (Ntr-type)
MEKFDLPSESAMSFGMAKTEFVQMMLLFNPHRSNDDIKKSFNEICEMFSNTLIDDILNDLRAYEKFEEMVKSVNDFKENEKESEESASSETND